MFRLNNFGSVLINNIRIHQLWTFLGCTYASRIETCSFCYTSGMNISRWYQMSVGSIILWTHLAYILYCNIVFIKGIYYTPASYVINGIFTLVNEKIKIYFFCRTWIIAEISPFVFFFIRGHKIRYQMMFIRINKNSPINIKDRNKLFQRSLNFVSDLKYLFTCLSRYWKQRKTN